MARVRLSGKRRPVIRGNVAKALIGDVNNDGTVDEKDLSIVHKEYAKAKEKKKVTPKKKIAIKKPVAKKAPTKKKK